MGVRSPPFPTTQLTAKRARANKLTTALKKEEKDLTKEQENGKKKMTDTGKEMTPVDLSPKMPKIKNEKNRV